MKWCQKWNGLGIALFAVTFISIIGCEERKSPPELTYEESNVDFISEQLGMPPLSDEQQIEQFVDETDDSSADDDSTD